MPTNSNPYSRSRSDRQQPGAITLGKRGRLGRGAQVLPTAPAAEVSAARPGTTFRNAHPRSVPGRQPDGRQFFNRRIDRKAAVASARADAVGRSSGCALQSRQCRYDGDHAENLRRAVQRDEFCAGSFRQKASYAIFRNNSHTPAASKVTPEARAIQRPKEKSFSNRMSNASSAIQSTFITPPTNKSAISTQQQPMQ